MFCMKCGASMRDDSAFCSSCGTAVKESGMSTPTAVISGPYQSGTEEYPTVAFIRRFCSSTLFLVMISLFSFSVLFQVIGGFTDGGYMEALNQYTNDWQPTDTNLVAQVIGTLVGLLPSLLAMIGYWMLYKRCARNASAQTIAPSFTVLKSAAIVQLIYICIISFILLIFSVLMIAGSNSLFDGLETEISALTMGIILLVCGIVVAALAIAYSAGLLKTVRTVKESVWTDRPSDEVSGYVAIINFIFIFIQLLALLSASSLIQIVTALCLSATCLLFGICIFKYKNAMRRYMYSGYSGSRD